MLQTAGPVFLGFQSAVRGSGPVRADCVLLFMIFGSRRQGLWADYALASLPGESTAIVCLIFLEFQKKKNYTVIASHHFTESDLMFLHPFLSFAACATNKSFPAFNLTHKGEVPTHCFLFFPRPLKRSYHIVNNCLQPAGTGSQHPSQGCTVCSQG